MSLVVISLSLGVFLYSCSGRTCSRQNDCMVQIRDTITTVSLNNYLTWEGETIPITTYERVYKNNEDTIYHLREEYIESNLNPDSLGIKMFDKKLAVYLFVPDSIKELYAAYGYFYKSIEFVYKSYHTYHISNYLKEYDQTHGDGNDYYITIQDGNDEFWSAEFFKNPSDDKIRDLVADAIIEYRMLHKWKDYELDNIFISKWKQWFMDSDVPIIGQAAIVNNGIIFSFNYDTPNMDISFGEYCVHALVPYSKLKGLLSPQFDILTQ